MLRLYNVPAPELPSDLFRIEVNGREAHALRVRTSRIPFNRIWPGHQRPMEQSELSAVLSLDTDEPVTLTVTPQRCFREAVIRPLSKGIRPVRDGNTLRFPVAPGDQLSLELDGLHQNLQIFANTPENFPDADAPGVRYFGPGTHDVGRIELSDGDTLVIDGGAVVYGSVSVKDAENVRICGHGVLCNSAMTRSFRFPASCLDPELCALPEALQSLTELPAELAEAFPAEVFSQTGGCLEISRSDGVTVEGILFRDSSVWTATVTDSRHISFDNVKTVGMWRYNSDGIDLCNSAHCTVRNSFLRNFDDVLVVKGLPGYRNAYVEDLLFEHNVVWCDWGRCFEIGAETSAEEIRRIVFRDSDLIHGTHIHMDIQNGDRAHVHDVLYEDIRIEYSRFDPTPLYQQTEEAVYAPKAAPQLPSLFLAEITHGYWNTDPVPGNTFRIILRNIAAVTDPDLPTPPIILRGRDAEHTVRDVTFENVTVNGRAITAEDVRTNDFAREFSVL